MSRESWGRDVFDRLYEADPDPWRFDTSAYEAEKYADTLAALGDRRFAAALELGCANGAMTARLAPRCAALLSIDISPAAIALARNRCGAQPHVRFAVACLPDQFAGVVQGAFDLIVISEMLYFLSAADIDRLASAVVPVLRIGGLLILVNWTGVTDTPCSGDEAAERMIAAMSDQDRFETGGHRHASYRLDRLRRLGQEAIP